MELAFTLSRDNTIYKAVCDGHHGEVACGSLAGSPSPGRHRHPATQPLSFHPLHIKNIQTLNDFQGEEGV